MEIGAEGWSDRFDKLKHDYEHHIDEEEDEVFARAKEEIDASEIDGYGDRFLKRKAQEGELIDDKREDSLED